MRWQYMTIEYAGLAAEYSRAVRVRGTAPNAGESESGNGKSDTIAVNLTDI